MSGPENLPAFAHGNPEQGGHPGMSLRDWFAGQALAGSMVGNYSAESLSPQLAAGLAEEMYLVADAMLAARTQSKDTPQ